MAKKTTEAELRALNAKGLNWAQVAEHLGMPVGMIRTTAWTLGIKPSYRNAVDVCALSAVVKDLEAGKPLPEVARGLGVSYQTLRSRLVRNGLPTKRSGATLATPKD